MNKHTDPVTLARELLTIDISAIGGSIIVDGVDVLETTCAAQKLARAVIAAAELADRLEANASELEADGADDYADAARTDAHSIRAALNGETHD